MEKSYFFDSVSGDREYSAGDFTDVLYEVGLHGEGVLPGLYSGLAVSNDESLSVDVATGAATKIGAVYKNTESLNLPLSAVTSGKMRIDRIVIRKDVAERAMLAMIIEGIEGEDPAAPDIVEATDVLLAQVLVDRTTGDYFYTVTDERVYRTINPVGPATDEYAGAATLGAIEGAPKIVIEKQGDLDGNTTYIDRKDGTWQEGDLETYVPEYCFACCTVAILDGRAVLTPLVQSDQTLPIIIPAIIDGLQGDVLYLKLIDNPKIQAVLGLNSGANEGTIIRENGFLYVWIPAYRDDAYNLTDYSSYFYFEKSGSPWSTEDRITILEARYVKGTWKNTTMIRPGIEVLNFIGQQIDGGNAANTPLPHDRLITAINGNAGNQVVFETYEYFDMVPEEDVSDDVFEYAPYGGAHRMGIYYTSINVYMKFADTIPEADKSKIVVLYGIPSSYLYAESASLFILPAAGLTLQGTLRFSTGLAGDIKIQIVDADTATFHNATYEELAGLLIDGQIVHFFSRY